MSSIGTTETRATCPYCGTGCGVLIESSAGRIINIKGDPDHPANFGRLCTKGSTLHLTAAESIQKQNRLVSPMRRDTRGGQPEAISWDEAMAEGTATELLERIVHDQRADRKVQPVDGGVVSAFQSFP